MTWVVLLRSAECRQVAKSDSWVRPSFAGLSVPYDHVTSPTRVSALWRTLSRSSSGNGYHRSTGRILQREMIGQRDRVRRG